MIIYSKNTQILSNTEILEIINLCKNSAASDTQANFDLLVREYTSRDGGFVLLLRNDKALLVGCCFILDGKTSKYIIDNKELNDYIKDKYNLNKIFVPSLFYIHPDFRNKGYAKQLRDAYLDKARKAGYTHAIGFGYFSKDIHSFYKKVSTIEQHAINIKDRQQRDISIVPI